jgi:hypothetical protein
MCVHVLSKTSFLSLFYDPTNHTKKTAEKETKKAAHKKQPKLLLTKKKKKDF